MKDKVYANAPQPIQELKEKIRAVIDKIVSQMCENVIKGNGPGGHMNDIVFHY